MNLPISHYVASLLERITGSDDVGELLTALSLDEALNVDVDDAFIETNTESFRWSVSLRPIQSELTIATFPGNLGALSARLGDESGTLSLEVGSDWDWVEINSLSLILTVDSALLQPLDADANSVRVEFTSGLSIDREGSIELLPHTEIDVGPGYLAGTDIVLMLKGLQPMLSGRSVPLALSSLVSGDRFEGVYVTSGFVRFLGDYEFGGTQGIQVDINQFMITASGVSGQLSSAWPEGLSTRLFGLPDDDWELRLHSLELGLSDSFPERFRLTGSTAVPLLPERLEAEVSLQLGQGDFAAKYRMRLTHAAPLPLDFGLATLRLDGLECEGAFAPSEMMLVGRVAGAELASDALSVSVGDTELRIVHSQAKDLFKIALSSLDLGAFTFPNASLVIENTYRDGGTEQDVYVEAVLRWQDLAERLALPDFMPTPPDSAQIAVKAHWARQPDDSYALRFSLHLELTEVERLWPFIPEPYRPAVDRAELILEVTAASDADIEYRIAGELTVGLPDFAALAVPGFLVVTGGDADGRVRLTFSIDDTGALTLAASDLVALEGYLPGLALPAPLFVVEIDGLGVTYDASDDSRGEIAMSGRLTLNPLSVPPSSPIATHLNRLLGQFDVGRIETEFEAALAFTSERVMLSLTSKFTGAELSIDPLTMLSDLSAGRSEPKPVRAESESVALDSRVGFGIDGIRLSVGELDAAEPAGSFEIEMTGHAFVAGFGAELFVAFSDEAIEVGVRGIEDLATGAWNTDLPVRLPLPPVASADLDACEALGWNVEQYAAERRAALAAALGLTVAELEAAIDFDALKARARLEVTVALLAQVAEVRDGIAVADRDTFVGWIRTLLDALTAAADYVNTDLDVTLRLEKFSVKVPFGDPRDMGVEGSILIFAADASPLHAVLGSGIRLSAGLSADLIYFEVEGPGEPIEIPPIGRYRDGAVRIGSLRLGYGYTSNSFNFVIDGGITLPPALIDDADTSSSLGAGIRLPYVTNLYFRLGIIPLPGPIPVVPIVDFNLDMRRPNLPGLQSAMDCVPEWDGFQLMVPDVIRADVKHLAFGILFSGLPIVHHRFDGDFVLGTASDGVSYIVDDYLSLNSLGSYQIPLLVSSSTPFFENVCVSLRIAGFSINFDIQHPFPQFSPKVVLEVLALLSSETFDLDPDGEIANIVRVAARDVRVTVPDWARTLFPKLAGVLPKDAGVVFNIADLVPAVQASIAAIRTVVDLVSSTAADLETALQQLVENADELLDPNALLRLLPASYRKFRSGASFVGFEARCVILLLAPSEAAHELARREQPAGDLPHGLPRPALARRGERPHDRTENLFAGREFESFTAADLAALGTLPEHSAIVIAARVKVFEAQRYRFLGYLAANGEFALVSSAALEPLRLAVLGIEVKIPFELAGRLRLHGRTLRDGGYAAIGASGWAHWRLVPGVLEAHLGSAKNPLELAVESHGRFRMTGGANVRLGSSSIAGSVDVSQAHALVENATLTYETSVVDLLVAGGGRLGPGAKLDFRGSGTLKLFGQPLAAVDLALSNTRAELSARVDGANVLAQFFDARLTGEIGGWLSLEPANRTRFRLAGTGEVAIQDATIRGNLEIRSDGRTRIDVHAQGALVWMGHEWVSGFATFSQFEYAIGGRTSIVLPLTYGTGQVPRIIAQLELGANFTMSKATGRFRWHADSALSVGLQLANGQFVPMISNVVSGGGGATASVRLISLAQFTLLPGFEDVELLVPDVRADGYMDVVGVLDVPPIDMRKVEALPDDDDRPPGEVPIANFPLYSFHGITTVTLQQLSFMALPIAIDLKFTSGRLVLDVSYGGNRFDVDLVRLGA